MRSLTFLLLRQSKNRLLELRSKPSKLVLYILAIGFMVFMIIQAVGVEMPTDAVNTDVFMGILFGFFLFTFVVSLAPAFTKGASLFCMEDVNYLFVAPIRPRTILLYGLVKTIKTIVIGSWFIIFQVQWMRSAFGVGALGILLTALGHIVLTLVCQIMVLFIYAFTNASTRRKMAAKVIIFAVFVPVLVVFAIEYFNSGALGAAFFGTMTSPIARFTPIVGWASTGITAIVFGEMLVGVFFLGLLTLAGVVFFGIVFFGNPDYYEDVLGATETAFEAARAVQEESAASLVSISGTDKPVTIKKTGISGGDGADVFLYKHVRESFRTNRLGLWGMLSIILVVGAVAWTFWARGGYIDAERHVLTVLISLIVVKLFSIGLGRGLLETYSHYIYLVPEPPLKKWIWANMESMFKTLVEAIVIFALVGIIASAPVWTTLAAMAALVLFTFYMLGISLVSTRYTDTSLNTGILVFISFAIVLVPLAPGVVAAVFVLNWAATALAVTLAILTLSAWMLLVGVGCFALSKGALHNCDMPSLKDLQGLGQ